MRDLTLQELEHIPKHPKPHQSDLRMVYFIARMHSLGKKAKAEKTPVEVLQECIDLLRKTAPDAEFLYDASFFNAKGKRPQK
jgi:hypothetical protein